MTRGTAKGEEKDKYSQRAVNYIIIPTDLCPVYFLDNHYEWCTLFAKTIRWHHQQ